MIRANHGVIVKGCEANRVLNIGFCCHISVSVREAINRRRAYRELVVKSRMSLFCLAHSDYSDEQWQAQIDKVLSTILERHQSGLFATSLRYREGNAILPDDQIQIVLKTAEEVLSWCRSQLDKGLKLDE